MRPSSVAVVGVAVACLACIARLDDEFLPDGETNAAYGGSGASDAGAVEASDASGCTLFPSVAGVASLAGDSRSVPTGDGGALWIIDVAVSSAGATTSPAAFHLAAGEGCAGGSATFEGPALSPSPLADGGALAALDPVEAATGAALYYGVLTSDPSAPIGLRSLGFGVALGAGAGPFVTTSELLWTADRPNYGASALRIGDTVYVWGSRSTDAFDADCFVARARADSLASASAYSYWAGAAWSPNPDDAAPITSAGGAVSVRPDPSRAGRLLMTYVPPLGGTLVVRSATAPEGPWSAPATLGECDLSGLGAGSFCSGAEQHPELVAGSPGLVLTYDARSFTPDAGPAEAFWPRLVELPVPAELP